MLRCIAISWYSSGREKRKRLLKNYKREEANVNKCDEVRG